MHDLDSQKINNKIDIPLGVFFFVCDPRFPEFSIHVIKNRKVLELKIWDYMSSFMPECKALGGIKIHIVETEHDWHDLRIMHQQIARFKKYKVFNAPPTPEFVFRLPSINNVVVSHPELADTLSCPNEVDNNAVGFTFTAKGWMEEKYDVERTAIVIANDFKQQLHEYNDKNLLSSTIKIAPHYKIPVRKAKELLLRAMWESEVDLMAIQEDRNLADYEGSVKEFGIHEGLPMGFSSMLVNTWDMDESDLNIAYDTDHYFSEDHKEFLDDIYKVRDVYFKSLRNIELFELRHTDGCPDFYNVCFNRIEDKNKKNSMYLADYYIDEYNSSPIRDFVNDWIDKHSDKHELELVEKNGKGKWNSCHDYYLEEAVCFIVQSASSTPKDVKFGKDGIDFVKNGRDATYAYHPLKALPFLCMVHTLYTFSDKYMYDFEKREKLFTYLQCYHNKDFHEFINQFYEIRQAETSGEMISDSEQPAIQVQKKSAGRRRCTVESCIMLDDKQNIIEQMKIELDKRPNGPTKAKYIYSLILDGTLSMMPSHTALSNAGLIKLKKTAWNKATEPYRAMLANRCK